MPNFRLFLSVLSLAGLIATSTIGFDVMTPTIVEAQVEGASVDISPALSTSGAAGTAETSRYIVRYKPGTDVDGEVRSQHSRGSLPRIVLRNVFAGAISDLTPEEVRLQQLNPNVESIEADVPMVAFGTQTGAPWGLDRIDQRSLPLTGSFGWKGDGAGVTVYVVDTGIAPHTDFSGRLRTGFTAVNDGLGSLDCQGHGTHVAGSVAGRTYGVAKAASLVPVRVLDCAGRGSSAGVIAGLDWIVDHHKAGVPAVANMSLGGPAHPAVDAAVRAVIADGVTVVAAAGNANADACTVSPGRTAEAITVAATAPDDARASFSNWGSCVDLFAPGVTIPSTSLGGRILTMSGTSMAAPHVAGAIAARLSLDPKLTPTQIAATLLTAATAGKISNPGYGTPNRMLFVDAGTDSPPNPATNLKASLTKGALTMRWTPATPTGTPIASQSLEIQRNGKTTARYKLGATTSRHSIAISQKGTYTFTIVTTDTKGRTRISARSNTVVF